MCEVLDGADCRQLLLQCDDFKGQVTGRQHQDAYPGGKQQRRVLQQHIDILFSTEFWSVLGMSCSPRRFCKSSSLGLNKWLTDLQKQVDEQQGGDGHWFQTAAARRHVWAWRRKNNNSWKCREDAAVKTPPSPPVPVLCVFRCLLSELCLWSWLFALCWRSRVCGAALLCVRFSAPRYGETGNSVQLRRQQVFKLAF